MSASERYYLRFAAAFVRGHALVGSLASISDPLRTAPLDALTDAECEEIFQIGEQSGLKLHKFKRSLELPRVRRVLGLLRSLAPAELLDIGSGRGVFLWPMLDTFPELPVTAIDRNELRARDLEAVRLGGVDRLTARQMDATQLAFDDRSLDVVTMLEVLEHIPEAERALSEAVRVGRRFLVLSVPSKEDDNPEHIHLFDADRLREMLLSCGMHRVRFEKVLGHLIVVANLSVRDG